MISLRRGPIPAFGPSKGLDWTLVTLSLVLLAFGLASIYSVDSAHVDWRLVHFRKQVIFAVIGLVMIVATAIIPPDFWRRVWAWVYGSSIVLLVITLVFGKERLGAQRWISIAGFELQPSELVKVGMAVAIAAFIASRREGSSKDAAFWWTCLLVLPVLVLLMLQPHFGATVSVITLWLAICLAGGIPYRYPLAVILLLIGTVVAAYYSPRLPSDLEYMRERIKGKIEPDPKKNAYQQNQAVIAIGSGGIWGKGFGKGDRTREGYVPMQHNDFIFTVVGEEGGLIGSLIVVLSFGLFFVRTWWIGVNARSDFGRMLAIGLGSVLAFHTVVNLGMNLGITPVVGLWLPFMSYGGTALWMCCISVGLLLSIHRHEAA